MKWRLRTLAILAAAILATAAAAAADNRAEGSFDKTLKVTGAVDLEVKTGAGSIEVRTGDGSTVRVVGKIRAQDWRWSGLSAEERVRRIEANPPIKQEGNIIRIGEIEDRDLQGNISISYELTVPADTKLRSTTGSGSQNVDGIRGPLDATTGSGSITLNRIGGDVRASTGSGSIRSTAIAGGLHASTGSGSIEAELTSGGSVEATTGSGGVDISGVKGTVRARTGSGSIHIQGEPTGEWRISSGSGGVTVRLPANAGFELNARTSSGSVNTAHPVTILGRMDRREVRGTVRGGGPLLDLSTSSGDIRIE